MEGHVTPIVHVRDPDSFNVALQTVRNALKEAQKNLSRAEDLNKKCNGFLGYELRFAQDCLADVEKRIQQLESLQALQLPFRSELVHPDPDRIPLYREKD